MSQKQQNDKPQQRRPQPCRADEIENLVIADIKAWAAKFGVLLCDDVAKAILLDAINNLENTMIAGVSQGRVPRGLLNARR
jgi:hypothetical protein